MDPTSSVFARLSRVALSAGIFLTISATGALSNEKCQQLETLARQYAGVELTSLQKQLKPNWWPGTSRTAGSAAPSRVVDGIL
jgi:hypothetical protein